MSHLTREEIIRSLTYLKDNMPDTYEKVIIMTVLANLLMNRSNAPIAEAANKSSIAAIEEAKTRTAQTP